MNKQAIWPEYKPEDILLMSALAGAGGFGGIRLLSEAMNRMSPPKPKENAVTLNLPGADMPHETMPFSSPKTAGVNDASPVAPPPMPQGAPGMPPSTPADQPGWQKILMAGVGLPGGFLGAKFMYDKYKEHQMNQKVELAKQQYLQQLQMAQQAAKTAEVKCVDSFCEAVADEMNKVALTPEQMQALGNSPELQSTVSAHNQAALGHGIKDVANSATLGLTDTGIDAGKLLSLGAVGTTLGALIYANQKKREREMKAQYPMKVVYGQ